MADHATAAPPLRLETHPSEYVHWQLQFDGPIARLRMNVQEDRALVDGAYVLKLNSYDLGVDVELADAIQRVRFEHPEVRALVVDSAIDRIFCSGANIYMLGMSGHGFKVNFCKYTNETRLYLEELPASGVATIAALNGTASGGGYELALACDQILLVDDGSSAVSFPETPLLAVLPGTGGLTRLVDKRKVRRDRADVFSTLVEGLRGKRAKEWGLVDEVIPKSRWVQTVEQRVQAAAAAQPAKVGAGVTLRPLGGKVTTDAAGAVKTIEHRYVTLEVDATGHVATLTVKAPSTAQPETAEALRAEADDVWFLRCFRELDDVLLRLRLAMPGINLVLVHTAGAVDAVLEADRRMGALAATDWLAAEIVRNAQRVLRRLDLTAKSLFAVIAPGSCFAGSLLELALASDRSYMLDDPERPVHVATSPMNAGPLRMWSGLTRLEAHFLATPDAVKAALETAGPIATADADALGLVTIVRDDLDWDDELRIAIEERAAYSPDALTGMEANLRFCGPETMETKIFARLSAWQNWIFQRPNAVGPRGALTSYGKQTRPDFDMNRT
jgi:benzoyl-CoA-dihydrodiol lyase